MFLHNTSLLVWWVVTSSLRDSCFQWTFRLRSVTANNLILTFSGQSTPFFHQSLLAPSQFLTEKKA
ncbi:hypothetical protein BDR04DRAFT_695525 [Suillus decipiens]|nr:hypothetical protein BDR04DRAFT_695525 [Suillus decipiens]